MLVVLAAIAGALGLLNRRVTAGALLGLGSLHTLESLGTLYPDMAWLGLVGSLVTSPAGVSLLYLTPERGSAD